MHQFTHRLLQNLPRPQIVGEEKPVDAFGISVRRLRWLMLYALTLSRPTFKTIPTPMISSVVLFIVRPLWVY